MIQAGVVIGGKYELVERLDEGGMGSVWSARHAKLGRSLAIKFIRPEVNSPAISARFLREACATASIRHRNVIDVIDYGTIEGSDVPYIVMELLQGTSFGARLRTPPRLPIPEVCDIIAAALSGLAAVHDAEIIHRDLKPENVFLAQDADGVVPKLVDFGISRPMPTLEDASEAPKLTLTGAVMGTPYYMSPEQIRAVRDIDLRTDLYSIGVILYEALTGKLPFESDSVFGLMSAITSADATPVESLRPEIPMPVAMFVRKGMARDREQRFSSARQMRDGLIAACGILAGSTLKSWPPGGRPPPTRVSGSAQPAAHGAPGAPGAGIVSEQALAQTLSPTELRVRTRRRGALLGGAAAGLAVATFAAFGLRRHAPAVPRSLRVPTVTPAGTPPTAAPAESPAVRLVIVHLLGLPENAVVRLDGVTTSAPDVSMEADGRAHRIVVEAPGHRPWSVQHLAIGDRTVRVQLEDARTAIAQPTSGREAARGAKRLPSPAPASAASPPHVAVAPPPPPPPAAATPASPTAPPPSSAVHKGLFRVPGY